MDGFKTLEQAKEMKKKVQASGYKNAKVVVYEGDKLKVVDWDPISIFTILGLKKPIAACRNWLF